MTINTDELTSPAGKILFMAVDKPINNKYKGALEYTIRLEFDASETAWRDAVSSINAAKIVTKGVSAEGNFIVSASSKFAPVVTDTDGHELDVETGIPHFTRGSSGKAVIKVKPVEGQKGNALYLTGVGLVELELAEGGEGATSEERVNDLAAAVRAAQQS